MRSYVAFVEIDVTGSRYEEVFDMPDDATSDEIEEQAKEIIFNICDWGFYEK